jgi:hypothetical protein
VALTAKSKSSGGEVEGALKVLMLALRIAVTWTLLSILLAACWVLIVEIRRR